MSHKHKHDHCQHENISHCTKCDVAFCDDCDKEWNNYGWTVTSTNPTYWNGSGGTSGNGATIDPTQTTTAGSTPLTGNAGNANNDHQHG